MCDAEYEGGEECEESTIAVAEDDMEEDLKELSDASTFYGGRLRLHSTREKPQMIAYGDSDWVALFSVRAGLPDSTECFTVARLKCARDAVILFAAHGKTVGQDTEILLAIGLRALTCATGRPVHMRIVRSTSTQQCGHCPDGIFSREMLAFVISTVILLDVPADNRFVHSSTCRACSFILERAKRI
jgi:hypothetical protein